MRQQLIRFTALCTLCGLIWCISNILSSPEPQRIEAEPLQPQTITELKLAGAADAESDLTPEPITYDIPLPEELQQYTIDICSQYSIDPALVFAVMFVETNYTPDVNLPDGVGIMAIHPINLPELTDKLNVRDLTDPKQNIKAGCYYLSRYLKAYQDTGHALIAYNCGAAGADRLIAQGVNSTAYSRKVLEQYQTIKGGIQK